MSIGISRNSGGMMRKKQPPPEPRRCGGCMTFRWWDKKSKRDYFQVMEK